MKVNAIAAFLVMLMVVMYPLVDGIQTDSLRDMARFIPDNALMYLEQRQGSRVLKDFTKSPLGKKFEDIDFVKTGQEIGLQKPVLSAIEDLLSFYEAVKDSKLFLEVFGKRFAVAILPPIEMKQYPAVTDYIEDNTVVIAKPRHRAGKLALLSENYGRYLQKYSVSSMQYGNHHIKRIKTGEKNFSMVIIEGSFVISKNEKQLRRCIDTFDAEIPALTQDADYIKIRKRFKDSDRFFYLPVNEVRKFITETVIDLVFPGKALLLKELETTIGFANFGYGSWNRKNSIVDKVLVQYNSDEVNSVVRSHIEAAPKRCSLLSLTSENPMAFYWSNTIKIKHFLQYLEKMKEDEPQLEKIWSTVESISGKNLQEITSLFGEEVSLVLEPGPKGTFFTFPLGVIFLKVEDVPELNKILEKIIDEYDIQVSQKLYGSVRYTYWTPSPQDGLQPLYGFWNDLVFFGNSTSLLQKIIDKKNKKFSLLDNASIKAIDPGFKEKNNSVTYFNNVELINVLQKGLGLAGMALAIEDTDAAAKARVMLNEIINPLLDGIKMYDKSCTRSYFTPDMVIIDSITNKTIVPQNKRIN